MWAPGAASVVRLETRDALVEKIAYTLANPVTAGLVQHAHEWPGAKTRADELDSGALHAKRPEVYFDPKNPQWPEEASLPITLPPSVQAIDADRFRRQVTDKLEQYEQQARATAQLNEFDFLGAARACEISPYERATSIEPLRELNPTFAVGRGHMEEREAALAARHAFRTAYRRSLQHWRDGIRSAVFPAGTWWMHVFHGAVVNDRELVAA